MKHHRFVFFFLLFLIIGPALRAQAPAIAWERAYDWNGAMSTGDHAADIAPTSDNGCIVAGSAVLNPLWDNKPRLLRLNASGTVLWDRTYGDSTASGSLSSVRQTQDGGFIAIGSIAGFQGLAAGNHGSYDILVLKLDAQGNILWHKCLGGPDVEWPGAVRQTTDGGCIISGSTASNNGDVSNNQHYDPNDVWSELWLVKLDATGTIQWEHTYGGSSEENGAALEPLPGGGYVVCGSTSSADGDVSGFHTGTVDGWLIRVDDAGTLLWQRCLGGPGEERLFDVRYDAGKGFVAAGYTSANGGDVNGHQGGYRDAWVLRLDSAGTVSWQRCLGGSGEEMGGSVLPLANGGCVVAGESNSGSGHVPAALGNRDAWLLQLDAGGNIMWQKTLGGTGNDGYLHGWTATALGVTVTEAADKSLMLAAATMSPEVPGFKDDGDAYVVRFVRPCDTSMRLHDTAVCAGPLALTLPASSSADSFLWSDGSKAASLTIAAPGVYYCHAYKGCDLHTDTFRITLVPPLPVPELGNSRIACIGADVLLQAQVLPGDIRYRWSSGDTTPAITVRETGWYVLAVSNGCERHEDSGYVAFVDCDKCLFVPDAFTPNGDGKNDRFRAIPRCGVASFRLQIFNRWGEQVFLAYDAADGWDGTYRGAAAAVGTYYYLLEYGSGSGREESRKGSVTLIR